MMKYFKNLIRNCNTYADKFHVCNYGDLIIFVTTVIKNYAAIITNIVIIYRQLSLCKFA